MQTLDLQLHAGLDPSMHSASARRAEEIGILGWRSIPRKSASSDITTYYMYLLYFCGVRIGHVTGSSVGANYCIRYSDLCWEPSFEAPAGGVSGSREHGVNGDPGIRGCSGWLGDANLWWDSDAICPHRNRETEDSLVFSSGIGLYTGSGELRGLQRTFVWMDGGRGRGGSSW